MSFEISNLKLASPQCIFIHFEWLLYKSDLISIVYGTVQQVVKVLILSFFLPKTNWCSRIWWWKLSKLSLQPIKKRRKSEIFGEWTSPLIHSSVTRTCLPHLGATWIMVKILNQQEVPFHISANWALPHINHEYYCWPLPRWHARAAGGGGGPEVTRVISGWCRSVSPGA